MARSVTIDPDLHPSSALTVETESFGHIDAMDMDPDFRLEATDFWDSDEDINSLDCETDNLLSTINIEDLQTLTAGVNSNTLVEVDQNTLDEFLKEPTTEPEKKRFKSVTDEDVENLFAARQAPSTKKNTLWGMKIFQGK